MTHSSATPYQVWSVLAVVVALFFFRHIYKFDRFQCFSWNQNASASFKRFMIYSYTLSLPCVLIYAVGFTVIKSLEGTEILPNGAIFPKEAVNWSPAHQKAILPLYIVFAIGWALEITTHLEELCFWTFLLNSKGAPGTWFKTIYFKVWAAGSVIALAVLVGITIGARNNSLQCEAFVFFAGSIYGLLITVGFIPILFRFPRFVRQLKRDGIDRAVIIRLTKCHELNVIRVFFRFFFLVPLLVLAIDGLNVETSHLNRNVDVTDLLATMAGVGCSISSVLTVMIFFPRSIEAEMARDDEESLAHVAPEIPSIVLKNNNDGGAINEISTRQTTTNLLASPPKNKQFYDVEISSRGSSEDLKPNYGHKRGDSLQHPLTAQNLAMHTDIARQNNYHPSIGTFTSPIALLG